MRTLEGRVRVAKYRKVVFLRVHFVALLAQELKVELPATEQHIMHMVGLTMKGYFHTMEDAKRRYGESLLSLVTLLRRPSQTLHKLHYGTLPHYSAGQKIETPTFAMSDIFLENVDDPPKASSRRGKGGGKKGDDLSELEGWGVEDTPLDGEKHMDSVILAHKNVVEAYHELFMRRSIIEGKDTTLGGDSGGGGGGGGGGGSGGSVGGGGGSGCAGVRDDDPSVLL